MMTKKLFDFVARSMGHIPTDAPPGDHIHPAELEAYFDGALPTARSATIRHHLTACAHCRRQWQAEQTLIAALQQAAPAERPLTAAQSTRLQTSLERRTRRSIMFNQIRFSAGQLAAVLLLIVGVGLFVWWQVAGFAGEQAPLAEPMATAVPEMLLTPTPTSTPLAPTLAPVLLVTPTAVAALPTHSATYLVSHAYQDVAEQLARRFNAAHPNWRIEISTQLPSGWPEVSVAEAYDCFPDSSSQLTGLSPFVISLDEYLAAEPELLADIDPALLAANRQDGRLLGLPASISPWVVYYNATHLAALSLDPPATNWTKADFWQLAAAAASQGDTPVYGYVPLYAAGVEGLALSAAGLEGLAFLLADAGADFYTAAPPQVNFDNPALAQLLRQLAVAAQQGSFYPLDYGGTRSYTGNRSAAAAIIGQGQAVFWPGLAELPTNLGPSSSGSVDFSVGIALLPVNMPFPAQQSLSHFISNQAAHPEVCWAWLTFLSAQPEMLTPGLPVRRSVVQSEAYAAVVGHDRAAVYRDLFARLQVSAEPIASPPLPLQQWWEDAQTAVFLDGVDPELALRQAQQRGQTALDCMLAAGLDLSDGRWETTQAMADCAQSVDPNYQTRATLGGFLLLEDAFDIAGDSGMVTYQSNVTLAEAVAFFEEALAALDFIKDEGRTSIAPEAANLSFTREDGQNRAILIVAQDGGGAGGNIGVTINQWEYAP